MPKSVKSELKQGTTELGLCVSEDALAMLENYLQLLIKWNSSFNLSGIASPDAMVSKHLLDSLAVSPYLKGNTIADIGTGAGLPGIPLAILNPDKHFILVDSNGKKTRFLFQSMLALKLDNITIENCRIEHYQSNRQIDIVMSRAFASLNDMTDKSAHLLDDDGILLAMKGRYPGQEIEELNEGFAVTKVTKLQIPGEDAERHLIAIKRSTDT